MNHITDPNAIEAALIDTQAEAPKVAAQTVEALRAELRLLINGSQHCGAMQYCGPDELNPWVRAESVLAAAEAQPENLPAEPVELTPEAMKRGGRYNWKGQPDRLIYLRRFNGWHQFKKIGDPREVWCEVVDEDLHMLEETADATPTLPVAAVPAPSEFERECADTDALLLGLGLAPERCRTEGGRLQVRKVLSMLDALNALSAAPPPAAPAVPQPLTDAELLRIAREHAGGNTIKLTRDVGPYEVTEVTHVFRLIADAIRSQSAPTTNGTAPQGEQA